MTYGVYDSERIQQNAPVQNQLITNTCSSHNKRGSRNKPNNITFKIHNSIQTPVVLKISTMASRKVPRFIDDELTVMVDEEVRVELQWLGAYV